MKKLVLSLAVVFGVCTMVSCNSSKAEDKDSCKDTACTEAVVEEPACDSACDSTVACDSVKAEEPAAE